MSKPYAPKVSVILVNYNGAKDTIECVQSLNAITYSNYEVIVVDNASTDSSVAELQAAELSNTVILQTPENLGFSGGNNVGIRYALEQKTDYILLLNNDTLVTPEFLNVLVDSIQKLGKQTILTSKILYAGNPDTIWYAGGEFNEKIGRASHTSIGQKDNLEETLREVTFISGCCMLLHADALKQIGELDESFFLYCEDLEYCCRAREKGFRLYYEPKSVIYHKVSASTGRSSDLSVYYTVRNTQYILDGYVRPKCRLIAKLYVFGQTCKRIATGEFSLRMVKKALGHYLQGIKGKV